MVKRTVCLELRISVALEFVSFVSARYLSYSTARECMKLGAIREQSAELLELLCSSSTRELSMCV